MGRTSGNVICELTRVLRWGTATGDDDGRLLERFLADRDESAFTALVARHGPMVLGVCRRVLRDEHDVEDAFQATFLILVRSAGAIRRGELVGPWIHGVAHRVAVRARAVAARRFVRERNGADVEALALAPAGRGCDHAELRTILDAELARLPEALRAPLVLCYLEGLTHEQAAGRLRQPVGTIRSRLSRGRERLRTRLARRGVSADDAAWGSIVLAEPVSTRLFETTVRSALEFTVHQTAATALVSATTAALAKGVLDAMLITKLKLAGTCALGLVLTMGGVSGYALQQGPGQEKEKEKAKEAPAAVAKSPEPTSADDTANGSQQKLTKRLDAYITELEDNIRRKEADLKTLEAQLDLLTRKREAVRRPRSTETAGDRPLQAAPVPKLDEGQKADGMTQLEYLDPNQPIVVPSSRGDVVTIFGLGNSMMGGMMGSMMGGMNSMMMGNRMMVAGEGGIRSGDEAAKDAAKARPKNGERRDGMAMRGGYGGMNSMMMMGGVEKSSSEPLSVRLAAEGGPRLEVAAVFGPSSIPLLLRGEKVQRLAIFNVQHRRWDVQDLREPVKEAKPVSSQWMTVYALGRRLYTYSVQAGKWSVLELPEGAAPEGRADDQGLTLRYGDMIYIYNINAGEWTGFDVRDTPKEAKGPQ